MPEQNTSVLNLLCSDLSFFAAEKRIADYVMANRDAATQMKAIELARASGTSEATVSRFCKRLGFDNYRTFQLALAKDVLEEQQPSHISDEISLDNIEQSLQNILANKISALTATIHAIQPDVLRIVLDLLRGAQIIQVAAVGNTLPVAMDAAFKFNQLGLRCVTSEISEKSSAFALTLTNRDVLLLISNSGKSRRLQHIANSARNSGTPIVLITNDELSPLAQLADYVLISASREKLLTTREFPFSRITAIAVVEVLYHFLLVSMPEAKENIRRHEAMMKPDKTV